MADDTSGVIKPAPSIIPSDWEKFYQLHRGRIMHEDNLIHFRMLWMFASQAILFGIWAGLTTSTSLEFYGEARPFLQCLTCVAAAAAAVGSWISISAARQEIHRMTKLYANILTCGQYEVPGLPADEIFKDIVAPKRQHDAGSLMTMVGPLFVAVVWAVLLLDVGLHFKWFLFIAVFLVVAGFFVWMAWLVWLENYRKKGSGEEIFQQQGKLLRKLIHM
jgi:hypothetical protein